MKFKKHLPGFEFEKAIWEKGIFGVGGADEVGRGSFAGPVVASCVVFDPTIEKLAMSGVEINDSKKLSSSKRELAVKWIEENAISIGIGEGSVRIINKLGIKKATEIAFRKAVTAANKKLVMGDKLGIGHILVDAFFIPRAKGLGLGRRIKHEHFNGSKYMFCANQTAIIKGDQKSFSIASASIIAKVYRDKLMTTLGNKSEYLVYKWYKNKGYGTKEHRETIVKLGNSKHHRRKFVETFLTKKRQLTNLI